MNTIEDIIYPVMEEMKENLDEPEKLILAPETRLFGHNSVLSSIDLVNLIVDVEAKVEEETGVSIVIANEKAMSRKNSPFKTVETLAQYIEELIGEAKNE